MTKLDFLIVGQGLAGSLLANELLNRGQKVKIWDFPTKKGSSHVAAGLYNPITGRKMVKTWLADELFGSIQDFYSDLEKKLSAKFHHPLPIYRPFHDVAELNDWEGKVSDDRYKGFVSEVKSTAWIKHNVLNPVGGLILSRSGYVDLPTMLAAFKKHFIEKSSYIREAFDYAELRETKEGVTYKSMVAQKIVFCEGPHAVKNPFCSALKFRLVKGEILDMKLNLPENYIVNRGVFAIPKKGNFRVGSTYNHQDLSWETSVSGQKEIEERLQKLYSGPHTLIHAMAGIRPATFDRKPFVGKLNERGSINIFNGLGAKGVSLAPYFSAMMAEFLLKKSMIPDVVNPKR